jgi:UTP:GlnB (protein PII) uridylyltransferase
VSVVNKGNRKGDSEGKVTKIFIHCTDQEGLFGAIAHALVAQGITIRNWKVEVRGEYAVSSGVVVDETGGPVTDPDTLARLHNTLELLTGQVRRAPTHQTNHPWHWCECRASERSTSA